MDLNEQFASLAKTALQVKKERDLGIELACMVRDRKYTTQNDNEIILKACELLNAAGIVKVTQ